MNPSGENVERYIVQLAVDQAAAAQTKNTIKGVQADLAGVDAATIRLSQSAAALDRALPIPFMEAASGAQQFTSNVNTADVALDNLAASKAGVDALADSLDRAASGAAKVKTPSGGVLNAARSNLGTAGGLLGAVGAGEAGSAASSIIGMTAALGPFGLALAGGVTLLKSITDAEHERTEAGKQYLDLLEGAASETSASLKSQIAAENQRREAIESGTQTLEDFQERIRSQVESYEAGISSTDEYITNLANINAELHDFTGGTLGIKDGVGKAVKNVGDFNGVLADANTRLEASSSKISFLNVMLGTQAIAANNAAVAQQKLTDAQLDAAQRTVEIDGMTREERERQIASKQREIDIIDGLLRNTDLSTDAAEQLAVQAGELSVDIRDLEEVTYSYADSLAAEKSVKDALTDASNAAQQGIEDLRAAEEAVADAADAAAEAQRDLAGAQSEHDDKIKQLVDESAGDETKARDKANKDRGAQEDKANKDRIKQLEQHLQRIADIEKQYARDYQTSVGERDAYAAKRAQETRADALDKEQTANDNRLKEIDDSLKEQLRVIEDRYDEQLDSIREAARKAIEAENQRYATQYRNLQQALDKAVAAEQWANNRLDAQRSENAFSVEYWNGVIATAYTKLGDASAALAVQVTNAANQITGAIGVPGGPDSGVYPGAAVGGNLLGAAGASANFPPYFGMSAAGDPRVVPLPPPSNGGTQGARPIVVNVNGMGMRLSDVLNGTLGLIDTLFTGRN